MPIDIIHNEPTKKRFGTPADGVDFQGLSEQDATARLAADGPNCLPGSNPKSFAAIVLSVVREPMFLLLLSAGSIYLLLGDRTEALFLLGSVIVVIGITLLQQSKTQRALESLRDLSAPRALVIREGSEVRISGRDVVRDDLLVLHEGDRVAADCILLQGQLTADESLLTGESIPVLKMPGSADILMGKPGGDGTPFLFASTVITKGVGVARVRAVGVHTAIGRIGQMLADTLQTPSGLQKAAGKLAWQLTIAGMSLAVMLVLLTWLWDGRPLLASLLSGIALAMAILPEEIPVVLTVVLALGAWRMSKIKILTRRVSALEALGTITILAVDKTGTITQNRMKVIQLAIADQIFKDENADFLPEQFHELTEFALLATPADPFDPMEKAIKSFGHRWLEGTEHVHDDRLPELKYELSSEILAMTLVYSSGNPQDYLLATKGAPEAVIDLCHMVPERGAGIQQQVAAMAEQGLRVLGVAKGHWKGGEPPSSQHDFDFTFMGLVGFVDPPRAGVAAAIKECQSAGIRIIMMTGDHPTTARAIGRQVGLSYRPDVITGEQAAALSDEALKLRLQQVDLCARLQPEQKLRLVDILQSAGEIVAMTGDGVNDAPALKMADVGIAMGERGTDVARESADLVLLDDSFASIVVAIRQGRHIYDNLTSAIRFIFAVHVPIIVLALLPALLNWPVLLLPLHIVLLELIIDPSCSMVFEAEPEAQDIMSRPPRPVSHSPFSPAILKGGIIQGAGVAVILLSGYGLLIGEGFQEAQGRTTVFIALILSVVLLLLASRDAARSIASGLARKNSWLLGMIVMVVVMLVLSLEVPALRDAMGLKAASAIEIGAALTMIGLVFVWLEVLRRTSVVRV